MMSTQDITLRLQTTKISSIGVPTCRAAVAILISHITCHMSMSCHIISCYRCLIEEHYGKALIKLAKSCSGKDEMG